MNTRLDTVTSKDELSKELLKDFSVVQDYLSGVSKTQEVVEALSSLFYASNKLSALLAFGVKYEVANTTEIEELFRRTSIATHILSQYSATESSKRFLNAVVAPILSRVLETDAALFNLEPSPSAPVSPEALDQACDLLLRFTSELLNTVEREYQKCPVAIRETIAMMQKYTLDKFPTLSCIGPSVLFLRYIGPSLIQPSLFGLEAHGAISSDHLRALINISKLLQTASNGIVKNTVTTYPAHDFKIKKFIESKLDQVVQIGNKIMNNEEIASIRSIIGPDTSLLPVYADQIKEDAAGKLFDTLMQSRPSLIRSHSDSQWQSARSPSNSLVKSPSATIYPKKLSEKRKTKNTVTSDKDMTLNFIQSVGKALRRQSTSKSEISLSDSFKVGLDVLLNMCEVKSKYTLHNEDLLISPTVSELAPLFSAMKNSANSTVQFSPLFSVTAPRKIRLSKTALRLVIVTGVMTMLSANTSANVYFSVQSTKEREDSSDSGEDECDVKLLLQFTESKPTTDTDVFAELSPSRRMTDTHASCLAPLSHLIDELHAETRFYDVNGSLGLLIMIPTKDIRSVMDPAEKKVMLDQLMSKATETWSTTDVFHFLECHGLGAYGSSFVSNSISGAELLRLEVDDLREIGVKKLGPLKKIMALISSLKSNGTTEHVEEHPAAQSSTYPIKCYYGEEIRVVKLTIGLTLQQIEEKLQSLFSPKITIKFKDCEEDLVTLNETSFDHYRETVQTAVKTQQSVAVYIAETRSRASSKAARSSLPSDVLQTADSDEALIITSKEGTVQYMNERATELIGFSSRRYDRFAFSNYFTNSFEQYQEKFCDFINANPALDQFTLADNVAAKTGFENITMTISTAVLPKNKIVYRFAFKIAKEAAESNNISTLQQAREKITNDKHATILFDEAFKVQAFNKSATDTFGYKLHEIVGKDVSILFPHMSMDDIIRHKSPSPRPVISQDKNGGLLSLSMITLPLTDGSSKYYSVAFSS